IEEDEEISASTEALNVSAYSVPSVHSVSQDRASSTAELLVMALLLEGWTIQQVRGLPEGLRLPLLETLALASASPPLEWRAEALQLLGRADAAATVAANAPVTRDTLQTLLLCAAPDDGAPSDDTALLEAVDAALTVRASGALSSLDDDEEAVDDGVDHDASGLALASQMCRLRWPRDERVAELRRLLDASRPAAVCVRQVLLGESVVDLRQQQQRQLALNLNRQLATCLGISRGVRGGYVSQ
ncbi:MAG: hypothetical protein MHM6MM_009261, partial [Cercozoa sp. M6MM]